MTIAIIGGAGFIGTVLARQLKDTGQAFKILDLVPSEAFPGVSEIVDVCNAAALESALAGCTMIYHLAAEHRDDVSPISKYYKVNVDGARNLVAAAERLNINTIVFSSTVAVYGLNAGESVETSTPTPFNDYGKSKWRAEEVFEEWAVGDTNKSLTMIRLVATFGVGNRGNIYNLISQVVRGKFMMVGNGRNKKSLAYVENVAAFLTHCQSFGGGIHIYNYADKPDYNMNDLIGDIKVAAGKSSRSIPIPYIIGLCGGITFDILAKLTGRKFPISLIRVKKFCADTVVNADKVHTSGFKAPMSMKAGLIKTIETEFK